MINKGDIHKLSTLARIQITPQEEGGLLKDINSILAYVEQVKEVSATSSSHTDVGVWHNVLREDVEPYESGMFQKEIIQDFPVEKDGYLQVKKIL